MPVAGVWTGQRLEVLKTDAFKSRWPDGVDPKGDLWKNQVLFAWSDKNGDGCFSRTKSNSNEPPSAE